MLVPQTLVVHRGGDVGEVLEELGGDVLVGTVVHRERDRDLEHVEAVTRHPCRAVALLEELSGRHRRRAIDGSDVVEPEEAALEDVVVRLVLAVHPPREIDEQLVEHAFQEAVVPVAVDAEHLVGGPRVHRGVRVAERPLVRRELPVRMLVPLAQEQEQLALGEVRVDLGERDAVEREIPRGEPGVLPRVGHREHVEAVEVSPGLVATMQPLGGRRRHRRVAVEPSIDVEMEELLRPKHAGERLPQHSPLVRSRRCGCQPRVERIRFGAPSRHDLVERGFLAVRTRAQLEPHLSRLTGLDREVIARRHLRAHAVRVDGGRSVDDVIVDGVFRKRWAREPEQALRVRLVVAEQELRVALELEDVPTELVVLGDDVASLDRKQRRARVDPPRPGVAKPQRRQHVDGSPAQGPALRTVTFTYTSSGVAFANSASMHQ